MRTSILSRSVIAVASLAIGSVALAATPATAATPSGITRDQVLTAVNNVRTAPTQEFYYTVVEPQLKAITKPSCNFTDEDDVYFETAPVAKGQAVDGLVIKTYIDRGRGDDLVRRHCLVTALASTDASKTLTGNLSLTVTTAAEDDNWEADDVTTVQAPVTSALSSDVFVTAPITVDVTGTGTYVDDASMTANGATTSLVKVTTTEKVADKKTKSEKKAAKKKLEKRNAAAKKAYKKALKKAGNSKSKKAKAKKAWSKKKSSYKETYKYATAKYKFVKKTRTVTENRPFAVSATLSQPVF